MLDSYQDTGTWVLLALGEAEVGRPGVLLLCQLWLLILLSILGGKNKDSKLGDQCHLADKSGVGQSGLLPGNHLSQDGKGGASREPEEAVRQVA